MTDSTVIKKVLPGLHVEEAERRLQRAGVAFSVVELTGKKGAVAGADCQRVIRCRESNGKMELLVSAFRTLPAESESFEE